MRPTTWLLIMATASACAGCGRQDAEQPPREAPGPASADPPPTAERGDRPMAGRNDDLAGLAAESPFIFVGKASAAAAEKDARGLIITRNKFAVERVVVGDPATKDVVLTTLGGTLGAETTTVSGMPTFAAGRTYLVFTDLKRTAYNPITGNRRGVFRIVDGAVYSYEGRPVVGVEGGRARTGDAVAEEPGEGQAREKAAPTADDPKTSGSIVSAERAAADGAGAPMRLDDFLKAVPIVAGR
ncbi:hypothetical protein [Paludisphaera mucosa]|uniref:Lipoprotein n=1 Tax=Paludisphaera mucosa TaxID=3030827 RepID=A0ABT6FBJ6_9BACT|nr:hypothetical protein [Paludisphaera mucosa]MDG3004951.1 hypothetical protein [Paludisphaera mucosa]